MAYHTVWIDDEACDGNCADASEAKAEARRFETEAGTLLAAVEGALTQMRLGLHVDAEATLAAVQDERSRDRAQREQKHLHGLWLTWQASALPRQPFFDWAHGRRAPSKFGVRT